MASGYARIMKWTLGVIYFGLVLLPLLWLPPLLGLALLAVLVLYSAWNYWTMEADAGRDKDLRPLVRRDVPADPTFRSRIEDSAAALGLRSPIWAVEESDDLFRYSIGGRQGVVVFSRGLLRKMTPDEVLALAGHELAHLKSRDTLPALLGGSWMAMLGAIAAYFRGAGRPGSGGFSYDGLIVSVVGLISILIDLVLVVVGSVAEFYLARRTQYEEHLADLAGARITSATTMGTALMRLEGIGSNRVTGAPRWSPEWVAVQMNARGPSTQRRLDFLRAAADRGEIDA